MKDKLIKKIEELKDKYLEIWKEVCEIESPTSSKMGVDSVGKYFISMAEERGWHVEIFPQERAGDVVKITMNKDSTAEPIALSGHMDTVHRIGAFGYPAVKIEGDKIYGPGVTDCKGGIVAGFLAMDALRECGFTSRPVIMYLQSDEEGGGKYSNDATINYICEDAKGSIAFLNLEDGKKDKIVIGRKGIATFEFTVKGVTAHAAACAVQGSNAIAEAAYKIIELEKFKNNEGLTVSCTVINGGTVHNIVPDECKFLANVRFAKMSELDEFRKYVEELCNDIKVPGCTCTAVLPRVRPAMEWSDKNLTLANKMNDIWREAGLGELTPCESLGGTDAAFASCAGIPSVDALGVLGGSVHTINEFGIISSLAPQALRIALAVAFIK